MRTTLTLTEQQHQLLKAHLFPNDGCEAVAFLLCGQTQSLGRTRIVVRKVVLLPYDICETRRGDRVTWPTEWLVPTLADASRNNLSLFKIHGHGDFSDFSSVDDTADRALFPSVNAWLAETSLNGSCVMLRSGRVFGRVVDDKGAFSALDAVCMVGADITFWRQESSEPASNPEYGFRIAQTFGRGTFDLLRRLRIGVVGCSGTGSPVIEELARSCVGTLVLVDPDTVEEKNLNRIWNATMRDAQDGTPKVAVAARAIEAMGLGTEIIKFPTSLFEPEAVKAIASCDVVFGCVDSVDGRYLLNRISVFYSIPYFDLGVKIEADGRGGVDQVCGSVHYLRPGGSSLMSRHVFNMEQVRAAGMSRTDPVGYAQLRKEGYIHGAAENRPAVIQLNTLIASLGINELLARLHPYRIDPNEEFAVQRISLSHGIFEHESDGARCEILSRHLGRGDVTPLLDLPELS